MTTCIAQRMESVSYLTCMYGECSLLETTMDCIDGREKWNMNWKGYLKMRLRYRQTPEEYATMVLFGGRWWWYRLRGVGVCRLVCGGVFCVLCGRRWAIEESDPPCGGIKRAVALVQGWVDVVEEVPD